MTQRKILIPLDGSEFSHQIVRTVRSFFDPKDVRLVLFRAAYPPAMAPETAPPDTFAGAVPIGGSYESYTQRLGSEYAQTTDYSEGYRQELLDGLSGEVAGLQRAGYTVSAEVQYGEPAQRIIEFTQEEGFDLIAMATHGRTGLGRLVLGSVAERVLRGVTTPVLLMRPDIAQERTQTSGQQLASSLGDGNTSGARLRLAVATDGSTLAQRAVEMAGKLSTQLGSGLSLLVTVGDREDVENSQKVMREACALVEHVAPRPEAIPLVGFADEVLIHHLAKEPTDLLVLGPFHDRGASSTTAIGATAQRLVQYAPTSVLMAKGRRLEFRRILACVAVDDSTVVDVAAQLARGVGAQLRLLHVVPTSAASYLATSDVSEIAVEQALAQGTQLSSLLSDWITRLENQELGKEDVLLRQGSVPETILKVAHDEEFDLIVVGSQSGAGHFLGSVANSVVRYAEQSVMVVRTRLA